MDHKEKLAELLYEATLIEGSGRDLCEKIADHLIANGVTVQLPQRPIEHKLTGCGVKIGNAFWGRGTTVYKCPKCGDFISRLYDFCYKCGQALDWGESSRDKDREHGGKDIDVSTKWIPVTERLPKNYEAVLTFDGRSIHIMAHHHDFKAPFGIVKGNFMGQAPITHWMPLPEPPKGE